MLGHALFVAAVVTATWILVQVGALHLFASRRHAASMALGFLASLPFVLVAWRALPVPGSAWPRGTEGAPAALGLFHAYFVHLLLFILYAQCTKHLARSVTLRLLREIDAAPGHGTRGSALRCAYPLEDMIGARMKSLEAGGFVVRSDGRWRITPRGRLVALATNWSARLYRSRGQAERLD